MSSGGDDRAPEGEPVTEEAPAYARDVPVVEPIPDPWAELTPSDPGESAPLPGFADAGDPEVTGSEVEAAPADIEAAWLAEDLAPEPKLPPIWEDPAEDMFTGDGPFAAPVDAAAPYSGASRFAEALRSEPPPHLQSPPKALVPREVKAELERPHRLTRRASSKIATRTAADMQRAAPGPSAPAAAPVRHYPKMRALLADPEQVPYGIEPPTEPASPPVPGTFFPNRPTPPARPPPADLDDLLLTMAEGLLIGESADGGTEVRVTLRDEFFAGTELRIALGAGQVTATLVPPDRDIYWQLNAHVDDLEARLSDRGLRVQRIEVREPGS